ncbi:FadR family transcriptional regulator [Rhodobacteraceae bacterium D3-12]|nr:FadR family transcriptional regulator [Rhodobacteraceae bacterium D3-12]
MPFQPIHPEKLSTTVVRQIELLILRGILHAGERLPSERELSEKLGVSRPSLREAIAELQASGLLTSRAGSGIFVADVLGSAFSPALVRLFSEHTEAAADYLSFRRDMEGLAAERAARYGSDLDLQVIDTACQQMVAAHAATPPNAEKEAALDTAFHLAIIDASHNVVMLHMMRSMYDLLSGGVFYNRAQMFLEPSGRADLLDQHKAINAAIQLRDGIGARAAVETHLDYVGAALAAQRKAEQNDMIARQQSTTPGPALKQPADRTASGLPATTLSR